MLTFPYLACMPLWRVEKLYKIVCLKAPSGDNK